MPPEHTQSPHKWALQVIKPYSKKPGPQFGSGKAKNALKTSALPKAPDHLWSNLMLHDWLHVVDWYDCNQPVLQDETVKHFWNLWEDAPIFTQSTLSCHLGHYCKGHWTGAWWWWRGFRWWWGWECCWRGYKTRWGFGGLCSDGMTVPWVCIIWYLHHWPPESHSKTISTFSSPWWPVLSPGWPWALLDQIDSRFELTVLLILCYIISNVSTP